MMKSWREKSCRWNSKVTYEWETAQHCEHTCPPAWVLGRPSTDGPFALRLELSKWGGAEQCCLRAALPRHPGGARQHGLARPKTYSEPWSQQPWGGHLGDTGAWQGDCSRDILGAGEPRLHGAVWLCWAPEKDVGAADRPRPEAATLLTTIVGGTSPFAVPTTPCTA